MLEIAYGWSLNFKDVIHLEWLKSKEEASQDRPVWFDVHMRPVASADGPFNTPDVGPRDV